MPDTKLLQASSSTLASIHLFKGLNAFIPMNSSQVLVFFSCFSFKQSAHSLLFLFFLKYVSLFVSLPDFSLFTVWYNYKMNEIAYKSLKNPKY